MQLIAGVFWFHVLAIFPFAVLSYTTYFIACQFVRISPHDTHADANFWLTGVTTGIIERFVFGFAVSLNISGVGTGMVMWTLLKATTHWGLFNKAPADKSERLQYNVRGSVAEAEGTITIEIEEVKTPVSKEPKLLVGAKQVYIGILFSILSMFYAMLAGVCAVDKDWQSYYAKEGPCRGIMHWLDTLTAGRMVDDGKNPL